MSKEIFTQANNSKLLKAKDVSELTSISRSHLHRLARDGKFPKPIRIGENRSAWLESEVQDWISECVRKHHSGGRYS